MLQSISFASIYQGVYYNMVFFYSHFTEEDTEDKDEDEEDSDEDEEETKDDEEENDDEEEEDKDDEDENNEGPEIKTVKEDGKDSEVDEAEACAKCGANADCVEGVCFCKPGFTDEGESTSCVGE